VTVLDAETLVENFALLDGWEDRYAYIIALGDALPPFPEAERTESNKVIGCQSQVWLIARRDPGNTDRLAFQGDSDARIVKGLIAIVTGLVSGRTSEEVAALDLRSVFTRLGLDTHLTAGRRNGLAAMVERIKDIARIRTTVREGAV
jgi:cysteine desulfuration protein SufE